MIVWDYLKTQASILQLENYDADRWWQWWRKHPFTILRSQRKKIVWTKRLIATLIASPWVMSEINQLHDTRLKKYISKELSTHNLKKIAITGSYGKTSVKSFLYTILDTVKYSLTTPGSFNTLGGIARVLHEELTPRHDFFIVELGAYHPGDIASLAEVIRPDFGILTAIGPQHLERFGSLEAIKQTKFELLPACPPGKFLVNGDDVYIQEYIKNNHLEDNVIQLSSHCVNTNSGLQVSVDDEVYQAPQLFGTVMGQNVSLAIKAALELGLSPSEIKRGLQFVYPPEHRLEMSKLNNATLIDDTYSSNTRGFEQMVLDLKVLPGKKALVTPGIVELGDQEVRIHQELGQKARDVFETIVGVGNTPRTQALKVDEKIEVNTQVYWQKIHQLSLKYDWIVLENDISEQYL